MSQSRNPDKQPYLPPTIFQLLRRIRGQGKQIEIQRHQILLQYQYIEEQKRQIQQLYSQLIYAHTIILQLKDKLQCQQQQHDEAKAESDASFFQPLRILPKKIMRDVDKTNGPQNNQ